MRWRVGGGGWITRKWTHSSLPLLLLLSGCGSSERLLPLAVGQRWTYTFRHGMERELGTVEVTREVPVETGMGWELRSPMGVSRLGYVGDRLVASQLGGAFLVPALPIGLPVKRHAEWRGWVTSTAGRRPAKATIVATEGKLGVQGRPRAVNRTVVTMRLGGHVVELTTLYTPGDAIALQEQTTDDKLELAMERVAGG